MANRLIDRNAFFANLSGDARAVLEAKLDARSPDEAEAYLAQCQLALSSRLEGYEPMRGADQCNKGDGPAADRWEVFFDDFSYFTCGHYPPHIDLN